MPFDIRPRNVKSRMCSDNQPNGLLLDFDFDIHPNPKAGQCRGQLIATTWLGDETNSISFSNHPKQMVEFALRGQEEGANNLMFTQIANLLGNQVVEKCESVSARKPDNI